MNIEEFRKAGHQAIDRICDHFYELESLRVHPDLKPGYLAPLLPDVAPEKGEDFQLIADDYQKLIVPGFTHWNHPSFFAYFPTGCTYEGILGDLYASSVSNPGFNWSASPACTELEMVVMDWAAKLLGLSNDFLNSSGIGGGCIQNTASDAALIAVVAARSSYTRQYPEAKLEDMVIYTTTQTHSLGLKAGLVLGLSVRSLEVTAEDRYSLRGETLAKALEEDKAKGKKPFILIATVGTTSSGAVDNLTEIKANVVKENPDLRVHVDAAWAGVAFACPETREAGYLHEINDFADSFTTNFHKWGLMNFDAATLWVRQKTYLTEALDITPPFLRTKEGDAGSTDFRNWQLALGRRFRSLKFWFVLRSFGVEGFQKHIRQGINHNTHFASLIDKSDLLSVVTPPTLALTVFRLEPSTPLNKLEGAAGDHSEKLNSLNKYFFELISSRTEIYLTQTILNGVHCIRFAVGAERTTDKHVNGAFDLLEEEARNAIKTWPGLVDK